MVLGEHSNSQLTVNESIPRDILNLSNKRFDECRLTDTIWSNQGNSCFHVDIDIDFSEKSVLLIPSYSTLIKSQNWW